MSDTWRRIPKGKKREPRPPEKGGHRNFFDELDELDELLEEANEQNDEDRRD